MATALLHSPLRKRTFFALGALTVTLGLTARFRTLSLTPRPFLFRASSVLSPFSIGSGMSATAIAPPQPPLRWSHTPEDILRMTKEVIQRDRETHDKIAALPKDERNYKSVFDAISRAESALSTINEPLSFYQYVSPNKELRDASNEAETLAQEYDVESSMRTDVYAAVQDAAESIRSTNAALSPEDQRLVDKIVLQGKRDGLALPTDQQDKLKALKQELSRTQIEFNKNFNEENGHVTFTRKELEGVPADVVNGYKTHTDEDGKELLDVPFKTTDIFPVLKFAVHPATRQTAFEAYEDRLVKNTPLLDRAVELRKQIASMLGYETWADYVTEVKMVKSGANVASFLDDLENKLRPLGERELEKLKALKAKNREELGLVPEDEFYVWDYRFYDRMLIEKTLDLDENAVKEYFPVSKVVPTILQIYQDLLGVRFEEADTEQASRWHEEVQAYAVWEKDAKDGEGFIGWCYLDLFPRASKYGHAAVFPISLGYSKAPGSSNSSEGRHYPVVAMVANLAKPTPNVPALMRHDDVVTFFHEMGHVFHGLLSRTQHLRFHGTQVARDFVEAPSQMLENWCWEPAVLARMSSHYKTDEPLSPELIEKIVKSRYVNVGLFYLRQLFFAKFDLAIHSTHSEPKKTDYTKLWNELRTQVSFMPGKKPVAGHGSFGHLMGGYDAGYYGYTYSLVFAADMYKTVFKSDPLDPAKGAHYRQTILLPGGSREETDSLKEFLGRPSNSDAFMQELFGNAGSKL